MLAGRLMDRCKGRDADARLDGGLTLVMTVV